MMRLSECTQFDKAGEEPHETGSDSSQETEKKMR